MVRHHVAVSSFDVDCYLMLFGLGEGSREVLQVLLLGISCEDLGTGHHKPDLDAQRVRDAFEEVVVDAAVRETVECFVFEDGLPLLWGEESVLVGLLLDDGETETVGLQDDHFGLGWEGRGLRSGFLFEVEEGA